MNRILFANQDVARVHHVLIIASAFLALVGFFYRFLVQRVINIAREHYDKSRYVQEASIRYQAYHERDPSSKKNVQESPLFGRALNQSEEFTICFFTSCSHDRLCENLYQSTTATLKKQGSQSFQRV
jgi:hypothetical protein